MSFIKLDRKLLNWQWKNDPNMMALWVEILLQANYEDRKWKGQLFEKGSFPTSVERLAKNTGLSVRSVRTCLNRLKSTNELTIISTKQGTKIIVNKWNDYQYLEEESDKQSDKQPDIQATNERQTSDNTIRNKEIKEIKNIYIKGSKELSEAFKDFVHMRNLKKKPLTDKALKRLSNKLDSLSGGIESVKIQILNQSVDHGWTDVYPVKEDLLPVYDTSKNKSISKEEEDELLKLMRNENYGRNQRKDPKTENGCL